GKSSLLTILFRLVEPYRGGIFIDGLDTQKLGLHTLRSRMEIISQDPLLFSGTLRSNLDIDGKFTDDQIWDALELVGMKKFVADLPNRLDSAVSNCGENFSVGQRQLLTLARALCARPRVLVMDEASSSIDAAADALLQRALRSHFHTATVLAVAHRLRAVADFDRVAVLDAGRLVEFGPPALLLARRPPGAFCRLVEASGPAAADAIRRAAEAHFRETGGGGVEDVLPMA
ncbi:Multidrug resistance-associated protein 4, partial [Cladochytrium tenue]